MGDPAPVEVFDGAAHQTPLLGRIYDPNCDAFKCNVGLIIRDATDSMELFRVGPTCMGTTMICPCIGDMPIPVYQNGQEVALICRHQLGCGELIGKYNRFIVDFRGIQDPVHRKLLFAAGMLVDVKYWDTK